MLLDQRCAASAPDVYAVGECASAAGRCWGLVVSGYDQAAVVIDQLLGGRVGLVKELVATELDRLAVAVINALCEHFDVSRAELFEVVRVKGLTTWSTVLAEQGRGRGGDRPTCRRTGRTESFRASRVAR